MHEPQKDSCKLKEQKNRSDRINRINRKYLNISPFPDEREKAQSRNGPPALPGTGGQVGIPALVFSQFHPGTVKGKIR